MASSPRRSPALEQLESLIDRVQRTARIGDDAAQAATKILLGFPAKISGEIVFADADNLDTDNIYAGKFTYQDDMTTADMAQVCMENYEPGVQVNHKAQRYPRLRLQFWVWLIKRASRDSSSG
jgi:hypothetical protein